MSAAMTPHRPKSRKLNKPLNGLLLYHAKDRVVVECAHGARHKLISVDDTQLTRSPSESLTSSLPTVAAQVAGQDELSQTNLFE